MTPQLQQAIKMLQLSSLELELEVQQALDSNMMLEEVFDEGNNNEDSLEDSSSNIENKAEPEKEYEQDSSPIEQSNEIPEELPIDSNWDDVYDLGNSAPISGVSSSDNDREFEYGDSSTESLQSYLQWQLSVTPLSETDKLIADALIDSINDDGYLASPVDEIFLGLVDQGMEIEQDEVLAVLHTIQNFDPPGVGAQNLQENLQIQLKYLNVEQEQLRLLQELIGTWFDLLVSRDFATLKRKMRISDEALTTLTQIIQGMNPRPGSQFSSEKIQYITPDVIVNKKKGKWVVELNPESTPRLRINNHYASLMKQVNSDDSNTLRTHLQEARWFLKSLQSRNETLLKVATSIVEHQREFLEKGEVAMKAMVLHDIATELGMHESTISRTTTRKYMHTPRGIFELKYFFSSHVSTAGGGECSSTAIRAMIKKLVSEEPPKKPLSDNKIAGLLSEQGINVARRTIAKYREALAIPPSNERKRLA
jgi:RNA polymerase sigma-54 factor